MEKKNVFMLAFAGFALVVSAQSVRAFDVASPDYVTTCRVYDAGVEEASNIHDVSLMQPLAEVPVTNARSFEMQVPKTPYLVQVLQTFSADSAYVQVSVFLQGEINPIARTFSVFGNGKVEDLFVNIPGPRIHVHCMESAVSN